MNTIKASSFKLLHLACAIISGGGLAATALLVATGSQDRSLYLVFTWLVKYPFLALVLSSVLLSTAGGWGFIRHRWIAVKWCVALALLAIVMAGGGAAVEGLGALRDGLQEGSDLYKTLSARTPVFVGAMCALFFAAVALSVFRPGMRKHRIGVDAMKVRTRRTRQIAGALAVIAATLPVAFIVIGEVRLMPARRMPIERIDLSSLADGVYRGTARVGSYDYTVEARVESGRLSSAVPVGLRDSPYAQFASGVLNKAVRDNRNDVDVISGATTTSKALLKALENALKSDTQTNEGDKK
jgi:uncharacterized protein with FMN-binding domain